MVVRVIRGRRLSSGAGVLGDFLGETGGSLFFAEVDGHIEKLVDEDAAGSHINI